MKCDGAGLLYHRSRNAYAAGKGPKGIGRAVVINAVDSLIDAELVLNRPGHYERAGDSGYVSRLRATDSLERIFDDYGIKGVEVCKRVDLLVCRDFPNMRGVPLEPRQAKQWRSLLSAYNELLAASEVQHPWRRRSLTGQYLCRIFTRGWQLGGRFYRGSWQNMRNRDGERRLLTIDGDVVVELDYSELHLRMLYADKGVDLRDGDPYIIGDIPRKLMKPAALTAINANDFESARSSLQQSINVGRLMEQPKTHSPTKLLRAFEHSHPLLKDDLWSGAGLRLQYRDSEICKDVLHEMTSQGILALPVHDSFVVATQHQSLLEQAMRAAYVENVGFEPQIEKKG